MDRTKILAKRWCLIGSHFGQKGLDVCLDVFNVIVIYVRFHLLNSILFKLRLYVSHELAKSFSNILGLISSLLLSTGRFVRWVGSTVFFAEKSFWINIFLWTTVVCPIVSAVSFYLKGKVFSSWKTKRGLRVQSFFCDNHL